MTYKDSEDAPQEGDKVLGDRVKGVVVKVKDAAVVVRVKGPWDPAKKPTEVDAAYDPATLVLVSRAPAKAGAPKK